MTPAGLAAIREATARLRDPETPPAEAARLAAETPMILWLMGNVHGGEESGTDAELRVLYELADRTDCAAQQILDNALVGIIPTQNPDGREAEQRQNAYFFDMNRDWFARTQRETDAKLELLRQYPGVMHIDAHEMGANHFFFPPAADPIYHEVTAESVAFTDELFGAAMQAEFDRQHIQYFNDKIFDFFAMVYGDTVPSVAFGSGGMTFEKANFHPISVRTYEQYVAHWVSLSAGALNREQVLLDWHGSWVDAFTQGAAGLLQPNVVNDKGNTVQLPVPDIRVRHYFLRADDPDKAAEVQSLVRRLQRMDVEVYRLTAPLAVPDFTPYGRAAAATTLPAGTYWVPMRQAQKHWIQALLNEDTYVAFPYFYDVSGWSNPLLFNVAGGRSGALFAPAAELAAPLAEPPAPSAAGRPARRGGVPALVEHDGARVGRLAALSARAGLGASVHVCRGGRHRSGCAQGRRRPARPERERRGRLERARSARPPRARGLGCRRRPLRRLARRRGGGGEGRDHLGEARGAEVGRWRCAPSGPLARGEPARERRRTVRVGLLRLRPRHAAVRPGTRGLFVSAGR